MDAHEHEDGSFPLATFHDENTCEQAISLPRVFYDLEHIEADYYTVDESHMDKDVQS